MKAILSIVFVVGLLFVLTTISLQYKDYPPKAKAVNHWKEYTNENGHLCKKYVAVEDLVISHVVTICDQEMIRVQPLTVAFLGGRQ